MFQRRTNLEPGFFKRGPWLEVTDFTPLAPIRAARLCAQHGLKLEANTLNGLRAQETPDASEQRPELERLLLAKHAAHGVHELDGLGWLAHHLPELEASREVAPFGFHHLNVLEHSIEALRVLTDIFPVSTLETRWATLLHDVGKTAAKVWDEVRGHWSFFGHDDRGAELARDILARFGYDAVFSERVALLIGRHMIRLPADETQAARFVRRQRALLPELLQVMLSDREAARGASSSAEARHAYQIGFDRVLSAMNTHDAVKPLLTGDSVMQLLHFEPGRDVGRALAFVSDLQESGEVTTADEARAALEVWARTRGLG